MAMEEDSEECASKLFLVSFQDYRVEEEGQESFLSHVVSDLQSGCFSTAELRR